MTQLSLLAALWTLPRTDVYVVGSSWCLFFLFARFFFSWWLFRDYTVRSAATPLLFAASLTFSLSIFQMVLFEVTNVLHVASRQWVWRVDLLAMTYLVVLVLPLSLFYAVAREYGRTARQATVTAASTLLLYLYGFWRLGAVLESNVPTQSVEGTCSSEPRAALDEERPTHALVVTHAVFLFHGAAFFSLRNFVSRVSLLGVVFMALLSGFGAVHCPYEYMTFFWRRVAEEDIEFLEKRLRHNVDMLIAKKKRLILELRAAARRQDQVVAGGNRDSLVYRAFAFFSSSKDDTTYIKGLEAEIVTLESLGRELFLEVHDLRDAQARSLRARTLQGRVFNCFGYLMSAFCVYKMVMSTMNVIFRRNRDKDPITDAVEKLLYIWPSLAEQLNIRFVSEVASLGFVGILVFTQTRGFLVTLLKFFRTYSSTVSSNSVVLWLAHLMGMYFVSSFVLMRMNLSPLHRERIDEVLGDIDFHVFHRYFDIMFVVSASSSLGLLALTKFSKASRTANSDYGLHDKFP
ncbi:hypothetical protein PsorP6_018038 [Peronosclerospora sorghi]|uniref:Uncharacterized protein n=1 Tax=Peronosclerospora sorghi TaxID=230839 RepID=A0ACC0WF73_9STRA|nr:hypothetical protein PsorP6_018038 [Peronosclerospora sorghi]